MTTSPPGLLDRLAALSSDRAPGLAPPRPGTPPSQGAQPSQDTPPPPGAPAPPVRPAAPAPEVLADRPDGTVVRSGRTVAKAHAPDADPQALAARLRIAAHPLLHGILLPPLPITAPGGHLTLDHHGRTLTRWPYGSPVPPDDPDAAPWEDTARLLARLHAVRPDRLPGPVPPMRGPAKAARALSRMRTALASAAPADPALRAAATAVERAWAQLPPSARAATAQGPGTPALCHGDLHLGQLVRHPAPDGPWLLIDVDDLGLGDPAWDLARPAAWFATGLLAPDVWTRFLTAYRAAGGRAVRPDGDPWPDLEIPARALTAQTAALAVAKAARAARPLDADETALVCACARMTPLPPGAAARPGDRSTAPEHRPDPS